MLIDIHALSVPEHYTTNDKGMAQIVNAGGGVSAAIDPSQLITQAGKDLMNFAKAQEMPQALPSCANKVSVVS